MSKKHIIPFGDRILVKREVVGSTVGKEEIILTADETAGALTDIATVIYVPDHTFIDKELIAAAEDMVGSLSRKVKKDGDSDAMMALLRFNDYCRIKSLKVGDKVMVSRHVGITFNDNMHDGELTVLNSNDVIGVIR